MIESTNKDYGFFGTIKGGRMVEQFTSKLFDIAGQGVKEALGCTDEEAAAVLDSRIGRHLADVVAGTDNPTSLRVNINSWISKRSWSKEALQYLKIYRQEKQEMGESRKMVRELLEASEHYLSKRERDSIGNALFDDPILSGREKVRGLGVAVSRLASVLDKLSFSLDMVSGDLLLGDKGSRLLSFRRSLPPGSDIFSEGPELESRIAFNWENLNRPLTIDGLDKMDKSYEIVCYLT